ncbi:MAG: hypothetical protein KDM91_12250 [Verrucomicrobiae bacterium]|nr:hypothetical protein [Verrucomicrobiae bacterium]MCP5540171.1 hypothetical protein [Akkermansiaceae bacterium]
MAGGRPMLSGVTTAEYLIDPRIDYLQSYQTSGFTSRDAAEKARIADVGKIFEFWRIYQTNYLKNILNPQHKTDSASQDGPNRNWVFHGTADWHIPVVQYLINNEERLRDSLNNQLKTKGDCQ